MYTEDPILILIPITRTTVISTVKQGLALEAVYSVQARQGLESSEILAKVSELNENMRVVYHVGAHRDSL